MARPPLGRDGAIELGAAGPRAVQQAVDAADDCIDRVFFRRHRPAADASVVRPHLVGFHQRRQKEQRHVAERVVIPNGRYRKDIGDRLIEGELDRLARLGVL